MVGLLSTFSGNNARFSAKLETSRDNNTHPLDESTGEKQNKTHWTLTGHLLTEI